ncbi:MAG: PEGA domain-containing protein [Vulcanimicrobiota bacterium]
MRPYRRHLPLALASLASLALLAWTLWLWSVERGLPPAPAEARAYPSDARLEIQGGPSAEGKLSLPESGASVEVAKEGFAPARLEAGPEARLLVEMLEPLKSQVKLEVDGPEVYTVKSGEQEWKSPQRLELVPGRHPLVLTAEGYLPVVKSVDLRPGQKVTVRFEPEAIPIYQPAPPPVFEPPRPVPRPPAPAPAPYRPSWTPPPAPRTYPRPAPPPVVRPSPVPPPPRATPAPRPLFTPIPNS